MSARNLIILISVLAVSNVLSAFNLAFYIALWIRAKSLERAANIAVAVVFVLLNALELHKDQMMLLGVEEPPLMTLRSWIVATLVVANICLAVSGVMQYRRLARSK